MDSQGITRFKLPDAPGIYLFKEKGKILYVGMATILRDRVRSYFSKDLDETRGPGIVKMVELADRVDFVKTDSVLEAIILEANEIKKHQPPYNVREKDDKSFNHVIITREDFPRILLARGKQLKEDEELKKTVRYEFGPYPNPGALREALKIIRRIFPFRDKCKPDSGKPCFNAQIGLCPGVCSGATNKNEYKKTVDNIRLFFAGKKKTLVSNLKKEMSRAAKAQEFEEARVARDKIFALEHIRDVALIKDRGYRPHAGDVRIEAYDIAHLSGKDTVGVMTVVTNGQADKTAYRKFKIKGEMAEVANDIANLKEVIERRLGHPEWSRPNLIVVDGGKAQLNQITKLLEKLNVKIEVTAVVKDEFHKAREILGNKDTINKFEREIILANSESHRFAIKYHRQRRGRMI